MRATNWLIVLALTLVAVPASAQQNQKRGAVAGGLAGAAIGAIIGDHNDEAGVGAAIGAGVGALAGGIMGNATDTEQRQQAMYQQQQQAVLVQQQQAVIQQAVSTADVVAMVRSGLPDSVTVNQIRQRGVQRRLEVGDIIYLHQQGVSEPVIASMQNASIGTPAPVYVAPAPAPVYVERRYEVAPVYVVPPRPRTVYHIDIGHGGHHGHYHRGHHHW